MKQFKSLAAAGKGKVAAILPDTTSSTRYVEFDAARHQEGAARRPGFQLVDIIVQNALGSDATQLTDAQTDITNGATVLLVDPLDSGVGAQIESYAKSHGVKVIDYDRLTLGGSRAVLRELQQRQVGKVMGQGLVSCVAGLARLEAAGRRHARRRDGQQRHAVRPGLRRRPATRCSTRASGRPWPHTAGTWDPPTAVTEFQAAFTAHHEHQRGADPE